MPQKTTATKIIDVAHPSTVKADANGVPLIVTNRPIMKDPMMLDETASKPAEAPAAKKTAEPIIKKIELQPLGTVHADAEPQPEKVPTPPKPAAKKTETVIAPLNLDDEPKTTEPSELPEPKKSEEEKAPEAKKPSIEPPLEEPVAAAEPPATEPEATAAEAAPEPATVPLEGDDTPLLPDDKSPDVQAAKAAREAAEKQLALDKLVAEGTYVLPINAVEQRRLRRTALVLTLIVVVALAVGFLLALDAGYIHIAGLSAPTNLIKG